eukprot:c1433_g1_i1.p2 GENE.c1433_g1_i1~~c1433_g1_i1.p2  ORF type:complete len:123 (-),score=20.65 c1433_g1_i1:33-401(-)
MHGNKICLSFCFECKWVHCCCLVLKMCQCLVCEKSFDELIELLASCLLCMCVLRCCVQKGFIFIENYFFRNKNQMMVLMLIVVLVLMLVLVLVIRGMYVNCSGAVVVAIADFVGGVVPCQSW